VGPERECNPDTCLFTSAIIAGSEWEQLCLPYFLLKLKQLLDSPNFAHVATLMSDGRPAFPLPQFRGPRCVVH